MVKNLPAMQENQVPSLGWKDPLEKEMATHSRILAWRIPWTKEPGGLQSIGPQRVRHDWATNTFTITSHSLKYSVCTMGTCQGTQAGPRGCRSQSPCPSPSRSGSQPWPYWHFGPNNSLLWGVVKCSASLISSHKLLVASSQLWQQQQKSPDTSKYPLE